LVRFQQLVGAMILGLLTVACTPKKESTLLYPAAVVAAHQEPYYRTALWCVYTKDLDSTVFRKKGQVDSIQALQRQLLAVTRHLEQLDERNGCIRFEFGLDFKSPAEQALMYKLCGYSCGYNPHNRLSPVAAVWVNKQDGLIDSVLDYNNIQSSTGPPPRFPGKREMPWNRDQPCKAAFLQQNEVWLNADLRQLCQDKNIISR
jgi:hypothetical protein